MDAELLSILRAVDSAIQAIRVPEAVTPTEITPRRVVELMLKVYVYAVVCYLKEIFRALRRDAEEGNDPATWVLGRNVTEWVAHATHLRQEIEDKIKTDDWAAAFEAVKVALQGNRWLKNHALQHGGNQDLVDNIPSTVKVRDLIETQHDAFRESTGLTDTREGYNRQSEHSHPSSACFMPYITWPREEAKVGSEIIKITTVPRRKEGSFELARHLIKLPLILDGLLELALETKVREQLEPLVSKIVKTANA